ESEEFGGRSNRPRGSFLEWRNVEHSRHAPRGQQDLVLRHWPPQGIRGSSLCASRERQVHRQWPAGGTVLPESRVETRRNRTAKVHEPSRAVDVVVTANGGGVGGQSGAVRMGLS